MEGVTPALYSELVPPGLQETPPCRHLRRKRDSEEEGVGFDPPPPFYGEGIPFVAFFGVVFTIGIGLRIANYLLDLSATLTFAGAFFLLVSGLLFGMIWFGRTQEDREHRYLLQNGIVVIGVATSAETLSTPDDFGSERTVCYSFRLVESEVTIDSKAQTSSGRLDSVYADSPVAVIYDPKAPRERHALLKTLHYTA